MKIALVQINPVIGDFSQNRNKIVSNANRAKDKGCDLAIFPELALCGYPPQDLLERTTFIADHNKALQELISEISGLGVICGHLTENADNAGKQLYNSASIIENGEILFTTHKRLLPTYDVFDEARYFEPGRHDQSYLYKGMRLGITVCEDIWNDKGSFPQKLYATDPISELFSSGSKGESRIDLLINISASPFHVGKDMIKEEIFSRVCRNNAVPLIYVNQVGGQDSLLFDGWSSAMNSEGLIVARAERFREDMVVVDSETWQGELHDEHGAGALEIDAVFDALVMGVRDYSRKE